MKTNILILISLTALSQSVRAHGSLKEGDPMPYPADAVANKASAPCTSSVLPSDHPNVAAFRERRFGMFIHWGPVSLKGTEIGWSRAGQRVDRKENITLGVPADEYDHLYERFNPVKFNADEWVAIAKVAGMKYIVLIVKHHDGFCMYDSALTDYTIMHTPFKRDVTAELATACRKAGLSFGIYYSPPDWHHPDFFTKNHARYLDYFHGQMREILTKYGPIDEIWFDADGGVNTPETWSNGTLFPMVRKLQPQAVITTRCGGWGVWEWGDFNTPEQRVGAFDNIRPWETCMTICAQWSWRPNDRMKSLEQCVRTLLSVVGGDGNLLFNVGPTPEGEIEARQVTRLKEMGVWVTKHADGIYGTRGGPFKPGRWGVSTRRDQRITLFVYKWPTNGRLQLPAIPAKITAATTINGTKSAVEKTAADITIVAPPESERDPIATAIVLTLDSSAMAIPVCDQATLFPNLCLNKKATASNVYKNAPTYGAVRAVDGYDKSRWATDEGVTEAWLAVDLGAMQTVSKAFVNEAFVKVRRFAIEVQTGDTWKAVATGEGIGPEREIIFPQAVQAQIFRLHILDSVDGPTINEFQLFH
jgi:alpha-L-fucosidase